MYFGIHMGSAIGFDARYATARVARGRRAGQILPAGASLASATMEAGITRSHSELGS